jgi:hypothetical protein
MKFIIWTLSTTDTQHYNALLYAECRVSYIVMLSVINAECHIQALYAECHCAE